MAGLSGQMSRRSVGGCACRVGKAVGLNQGKAVQRNVCPRGSVAHLTRVPPTQDFRLRLPDAFRLFRLREQLQVR